MDSKQIMTVINSFSSILYSLDKQKFDDMNVYLKNLKSSGVGKDELLKTNVEQLNRYINEVTKDGNTKSSVSDFMQFKMSTDNNVSFSDFIVKDGGSKYGDDILEKVIDVSVERLKENDTSTVYGLTKNYYSADEKYTQLKTKMIWTIANRDQAIKQAEKLGMEVDKDTFNTIGGLNNLSSTLDEIEESKTVFNQGKQLPIGMAQMYFNSITDPVSVLDDNIGDTIPETLRVMYAGMNGVGNKVGLKKPVGAISNAISNFALRDGTIAEVRRQSAPLFSQTDSLLERKTMTASKLDDAMKLASGTDDVALRARKSIPLLT